MTTDEDDDHLEVQSHPESHHQEHEHANAEQSGISLLLDQSTATANTVRNIKNESSTTRTMGHSSSSYYHHQTTSSYYLSPREAHELHRLLQKVCAAGVIKLPKDERPKLTRRQRRSFRGDGMMNDDDEDNDYLDEEEEDEEENINDEDEYDDDELDDENLPHEEVAEILNDNTISEAAKEEKLEALRNRVIKSKKQQNEINASAARCILKSLEEEGYLASIPQSQSFGGDDASASSSCRDNDGDDDDELDNNNGDASDFFNGTALHAISKELSEGATAAATPLVPISSRKRSVKLISEPHPPSSLRQDPSNNSSSTASFRRKKALQESVIDKMKGAVASSKSSSKKRSSSHHELSGTTSMNTLEMSGIEMVPEGSIGSASLENSKSNLGNTRTGSMRSTANHTSSKRRSSVSLLAREGSGRENQQQQQLSPGTSMRRDKSTLRSLFGHTRRQSATSLSGGVDSHHHQQHQQRRRSSLSPTMAASAMNKTGRRMSKSHHHHHHSSSAAKHLLSSASAASASSGSNAARTTTDTVTSILSALAGVFACRFVAVLVPDELKLRELRCVAYAGADAASKSMDSFSSSSSGSNNLLVPAASLALHHNTVINVRYPADDDDNDSDAEGSDLKELALKRERARTAMMLKRQQQQQQQAGNNTNNKKSAAAAATSTTSGGGSALSFGAVSTALSVPIPGPNNYSVAVLHIMDRSFGVENFSREDEAVAWCYAKLISRIIGAFESRRRVAPDRQIQRALATVLKSVENVDGNKIRKLLDGDLSEVNAASIQDSTASSSSRASARNRVDKAWDDSAGTRAPPVFRTYSYRVEVMLQRLKDSEVLFTTKASEAKGSIVDCEYHVNLDHFSKKKDQQQKQEETTTNLSANQTITDFMSSNRHEASKNHNQQQQQLHPTVAVDDLLPLCVLTDHVHRVADAWYRTAALLAESRSEVTNLQTEVKRLTKDVNTMRLKLDVQRQLLSTSHSYQQQQGGGNNNNNHNSSSRYHHNVSRQANNNSPSSSNSPPPPTHDPSLPPVGNSISFSSSSSVGAGYHLQPQGSSGVGGIVIKRDPVTGEVAITKQNQSHVPGVNSVMMSNLSTTGGASSPLMTSSSGGGGRNSPPVTPRRKKSVTISSAS